MNDINIFLEKRSTRINDIEIANAIFKEIGDKFYNRQSMSVPEDRDPFDDGCICQFFAYIQTKMVYLICNDFITIIGNYDPKADLLKAWTDIDFGKEKDAALLTLKEIRNRYSHIRNNLISHVNGDSDEKILANNPGIETRQISEDISALREILNKIRNSYGISLLIHPYTDLEHYPVHGVKKLIELFNRTCTGEAASINESAEIN